MKLTNPTWAEINLDNLEHNFREMERLCENSSICAVVKANAYGHGSVEVSKFLQELGVNYFAVSSLDEGMELRKAGLTGHIMMLTALIPGTEEIAIENSIESTVYSLDQAIRLEQIAKKLNKTYNIHIKLDTGMRRIGFACEEASIEAIKEISRLKNLKLKGIFTHFASADEAHNIYTRDQYKLFMDMVEALHDYGIIFDIKHVDNDAALLMYNYREDMVRLGIGLYGLYPSSYVNAQSQAELRPVMTLKSKITHIKTVDKGKSIGYGQTYTALSERKIATVAIGYADGYPRLLSNKGKVEIRGVLCPIVGRICMDQLMVDVTEVEGIELYDQVILFGDKDNKINVNTLSQECDTISYEILSSVNRRVPRVYIRGGKTDSIVSFLAL